MTSVSNFESWEKRQKLGEGAFGQVFLVSTSNGDQLAAKYIKLASAGLQYIPPEVEKEIKMLKQLRHPNVVQFVALKRAGGDMVVFTEFIDGKELADLGKLSEATAIVYLGQICSGLNYLHTRSPPVLHRDIKGQNIMVARDGTVKLIDFGLSINIMVASGINVTQAIMTTGNACGTLPFMAPEIFAERSQFSVKSDVWALGMTIYQMMTGELPFADVFSMGMYGLVSRIVTSGAPQLPAGCSQQLANFYASCTAMDPAARKSARKLLQHRLFADARSAGHSCSAL